MPLRFDQTARRAWTKSEFVASLPDRPLDILDVGAGPRPFRGRAMDTLTTVDFADQFNPDVVADVATEWPFESDRFDLVYMSHVLEHFYPHDRDGIVRNIYTSLRPGGLLFIRVPHRSSMQGVGWEHYSTYQLNSFIGLVHGENPTLPRFEAVSNGVATTIAWDAPRRLPRRIIEKVLNRSWNLTERYLARIFQPAEVQMLLRKPMA